MGLVKTTQTSSFRIKSSLTPYLDAKTSKLNQNVIADTYSETLNASDKGQPVPCPRGPIGKQALIKGARFMISLIHKPNARKNRPDESGPKFRETQRF